MKAAAEKISWSVARPGFKRKRCRLPKLQSGVYQRAITVLKSRLSHPQDGIGCWSVGDVHVSCDTVPLAVSCLPGKSNVSVTLYFQTPSLALKEWLELLL